MADWSNSLRASIDTIEANLAEAIGLRDGMRGDEFEEALGRFLEFEGLVPTVARFLRLGGPQPMSTNSEIDAWFSRIESRSRRVIEAVHTSLYENFNAQRIDRFKTINAYGHLLSNAQRSEGERLVCATTNYDPSLEIALDGGLLVRDGFSRARSWETPRLDPSGLVEASRRDPQVVPVLHLHGAVGWYRNEGVIEFQSPDKEFNRSLGVRALLLPDPNKDPSKFVGVDSIWSEFRDALETSTHVLVLGHSLHDDYLVNELSLHTLNARLGVTVLNKVSTEVERIHALLPEADILEMEFGPEMGATVDEYVDWFS
jgi:hypothetical protein